MEKFVLNINQETFWNKDEFLKFLVENQGHPIKIDTNNEGVCLRNAGIYKLLEMFRYNDVKICTSNSLETHDHYDIRIELFDKFFYNISNIDTKYHIWDLSKIFGCFYNRPTWYRIGLASFLHAHHSIKSLINFRANPFIIEQFNSFDLNHLLSEYPTGILDFSHLMTQLPMIVDDEKSFRVGGHAELYENRLKNHYTKFFIELVAETWTEGNTFAPTEKTTRPINFKKPFIVYGSRDYLCYLRQMGFRTFSDFWNEDYDGYEGVERYKRILTLIDNLSKKSVEQLQSMYYDMQYTLEHNHRLLINKTFTTAISPII